jgi:hypothetical protein
MAKETKNYILLKTITFTIVITCIKEQIEGQADGMAILP